MADVRMSLYKIMSQLQLKPDEDPWLEYFAASQATQAAWSSDLEVPGAQGTHIVDT